MAKLVGYVVAHQVEFSDKNSTGVGIDHDYLQWRHVAFSGEDQDNFPWRNICLLSDVSGRGVYSTSVVLSVVIGETTVVGRDSLMPVPGDLAVTDIVVDGSGTQGIVQSVAAGGVSCVVLTVALAGGGGAWGTITGDLAAQLDLIRALRAKTGFPRVLPKLREDRGVEPDGDVVSSYVPIEGALDYSSDDNWWVKPHHVVDGKDIFIVAPTLVGLNTEDPSKHYMEVDDPVAEEGARFFWETVASIFEGLRVNLYMPKYRQYTYAYEYSHKLLPSPSIFDDEPVPPGDVWAAFDYYIRNFNQGREIIFFGHSQGAMQILHLLDGYMPFEVGSDVRGRILAAYCLGYGFNAADYENLGNYMSFSESAGDVNCIISWNTCFEDDIGKDSLVFRDATACTNPVSWKKNDGDPWAYQRSGFVYFKGEGLAGPLTQFTAGAGFGAMVVTSGDAYVLSNTKGVGDYLTDAQVAEFGDLGLNCGHLIDVTLWAFAIRDNLIARCGIGVDLDVALAYEYQAVSSPVVPTSSVVIPSLGGMENVECDPGLAAYFANAAGNIVLDWGAIYAAFSTCASLYVMYLGDFLSQDPLVDLTGFETYAIFTNQSGQFSGNLNEDLYISSGGEILDDTHYRLDLGPTKQNLLFLGMAVEDLGVGVGEYMVYVAFDVNGVPEAYPDAPVTLLQIDFDSGDGASSFTVNQAVKDGLELFVMVNTPFDSDSFDLYSGGAWNTGGSWSYQGFTASYDSTSQRIQVWFPGNFPISSLADGFSDRAGQLQYACLDNRNKGTVLHCQYLGVDTVDDADKFGYTQRAVAEKFNPLITPETALAAKSVVAGRVDVRVLNITNQSDASDISFARAENSGTPGVIRLGNVKSLNFGGSNVSDTLQAIRGIAEYLPSGQGGSFLGTRGFKNTSQDASVADPTELATIEFIKNFAISPHSWSVYGGVMVRPNSVNVVLRGNHMEGTQDPIYATCFPSMGTGDTPIVASASGNYSEGLGVTVITVDVSTWVGQNLTDFIVALTPVSVGNINDAYAIGKCFERCVVPPNDSNKFYALSATADGGQGTRLVEVSSLFLPLSATDGTNTVTVQNNGTIFRAQVVNGTHTAFVQLKYNEVQLRCNTDAFGSESVVYSEDDFMGIERKLYAEDKVNYISQQFYLQDGLKRPQYDYKQNSEQVSYGASGDANYIAPTKVTGAAGASTDLAMAEALKAGNYISMEAAYPLVSGSVWKLDGTTSVAISGIFSADGVALSVTDGRGSVVVSGLTYAAGSYVDDTQDIAFLSDIAAEISTVTAEISSLSTQVGTNTTSISSLSTQVGTNTTAISNLSTQVGTNTTAISNLSTTVSGNSTAISNLSAKVPDFPSDAVADKSYQLVARYDGSTFHTEWTEITS